MYSLPSTHGHIIGNDVGLPANGTTLHRSAASPNHQLTWVCDGSSPLGPVWVPWVGLLSTPNPPGLTPIQNLLSLLQAIPTVPGLSQYERRCSGAKDGVVLLSS